MLAQFCTFAIVSPDPPDPNHPTSNQSHRIPQRQILNASNQIGQWHKCTVEPHIKDQQDH